VRLTAAAESDFLGVVAWTLERFGNTQARTYAETLSAAIDSLTAGPAIAGIRERSDIGKGLFTLHVARGGRKGRHFLLFRIGTDREERWIEVLRILHDAMDLQRHAPSVQEEP
jgi:toxin ParE1/3/4